MSIGPLVYVSAASEALRFLTGLEVYKANRDAAWEAYRFNVKQIDEAASAEADRLKRESRQTAAAVKAAAMANGLTGPLLDMLVQDEAMQSSLNYGAVDSDRKRKREAERLRLQGQLTALKASKSNILASVLNVGKDYYTNKLLGGDKG